MSHVGARVGRQKDLDDTQDTRLLHSVVAQQCAHATMREFNGFMSRSRVHTRLSAERNCIRLRNCASTCYARLIKWNAYLWSHWLAWLVGVTYTLLDPRDVDGDSQGVERER